MYPRLIKTIHKYVVEEKLAYLKDEQTEKVYVLNDTILLVLSPEWECMLKVKESNHLENGREVSLESVRKIATQPYQKKDLIKIAETIDLQCYLIKHFNYRLNTRKENSVNATLVDVLVKELFKDSLLEVSCLEGREGIIQIRKYCVEDGIKVILALKEEETFG